MEISCLIEILEAFQNCNGNDLKVEFEVIKFPALNIALTPYMEPAKKPNLIQG